MKLSGYQIGNLTDIVCSLTDLGELEILVTKEIDDCIWDTIPTINATKRKIIFDLIKRLDGRGLIDAFLIAISNTINDDRMLVSNFMHQLSLKKNGSEAESMILSFSHRIGTQSEYTIPRKEYIEKVNLCLRGSRHRLCIIEGPQGFGKTSLACQVLLDWDGHRALIDVRRSSHATIPPPADMPEDALVVLENLEANDLSANSAWLASHAGRLLRGPGSTSLIVNTSNIKITDRILQLKGLFAEREAVVVNLEGFAANEAIEFYSACVNRPTACGYSQNDIRRLNQKLSGSPLLWQMVADLAWESNTIALFEPLPTDADIRQVQRYVFELWCKGLLRGDNSEITLKLLYILSCISIIGSDYVTLAFVISQLQGTGGCTAQQVEYCLEPLIARGLLRRPVMGDIAIVPHSVIREGCLATAPGVIDSSDVKLIMRRYMTSLLTSPSLLADRDSRSAKNFIGLLDTWVVCFQDLFDSNRNYANDRDCEYYRRYCEMSAELRLITGTFSSSTLHMQWVMKYFKSQMEQLECYQRNGVIELLVQVPNRSAIYAELLWEAARWNDSDSLQDITSVVSAIRGAGIHWSGEREDIKRVAEEEYSSRIESCVNCAVSDGRKGSNLEIAALLGGLCILGRPERSIQLCIYWNMHTTRPEVVLPIACHLLFNAGEKMIIDFIAIIRTAMTDNNDIIILERLLAFMGYRIPLSPAGVIRANLNRLFLLLTFGLSTDDNRLLEFIQRLDRFSTPAEKHMKNINIKDYDSN